MKIELRFFASLREKLRLSQEVLELPDNVATVGDLRSYLSARGSLWNDALADGRALRMAVNQELASSDTVLIDGGEVAFFPPVTGG